MPVQHNRKNEHVSLAENFYGDQTRSYFDDIQFVHHSFPSINVKDVSLQTKFAGCQLDAPFFINAMTGGSPWTGKVNQKLAQVARETNLAIATGSVSAALKTPDVADSYKLVRSLHPNGIVFANLGAGHGLENAKRAVDLLQADALQIHLNAPQEVVMPEGDREFTQWATNIEEIVNGLDVPVIVKEVGFGMSRETCSLLHSLGVKTVDVSGKGGTNFAQIENFRRKVEKLDDLEEWGQSTPVSLLETHSFRRDLTILSSGGIKRPMDIVKSLALGATAVGISGELLHLVLKHGVDETVLIVEAWKKEISRMMTLLGTASIQEFDRTDLIIRGETREWCEARGIEWKQFANRSSNSSLG